MRVAAFRRSIATVEALGRCRPTTTSARNPLLVRSFTQTTASYSVAPKRPSTYAQATATRANTGPPPTTERTAAADSTSSSPSIPVSSAPTGAHEPTTDNILHSGLADRPQELEQSANGNGGGERVDWTRSFHGISSEPFPKEVADVLLAPIDPDEVEIKPDGIVYLPEIKYRRILNKAFGPGGWGLVPRSESIVTPKTVTREYALICNGRLVSIARGEQDYFSPDGIPTATEGCKSNALVRCCKDLGIASELWDPRWIRKFKAEYTREVFVEHVVNRKKTKIWIRKDDTVMYPWKETK